MRKILLVLALLLCGCSGTNDMGSTQTTKIISETTIQTTTTKVETTGTTVTDLSEEEPLTSTGKNSEVKATTVGISEKQSITSVDTLSVSGTTLCDSSGNVVKLRGLSTHGISWFPEYVNYDLMKQAHDEWGVNVFRLAMYSDDYNGYCSGGDQNTLKKLIDQAVNWAKELDMYVIIDWHILSDGNPNTHKNEAIAFFTEMSKKYKDVPNVIYEICNEPNGASWSEVKNYANEVIPVIRENSDGVIIVGTPTWSQDVDVVSKDPLTGYSNIMYALHFYAATHKSDLQKKLKTAHDNGLPVFVSEFGICDASGNGSNDIESANTWMNLLDDLDISYVMWNVSNKNESSAMFKSSVTKTSGFEESDLSEAGLWFVNYGHVGTKTTNKVTTSITKTTTIAPTGKALSVVSDNSWDGGAQYNVTITNTTTKAISDWTLTITFHKNVNVDNLWCGTYTLNGNVLTIKPESYNATINVGDSINNIGFVVSGDDVSIESSTISY